MTVIFMVWFSKDGLEVSWFGHLFVKINLPMAVDNASLRSLSGSY